MHILHFVKAASIKKYNCYISLWEGEENMEDTGYMEKTTSFIEENSTIIHIVLDVVGLIPRVGVVADVINAAFYAVEGGWEGVVLSLISSIPGVGDVIGSIILSRKMCMAIKGIDFGLKALPQVKRARAYVRLMRGKAKTGARSVYYSTKRWFKRLGRLVKSCFTGDTLVYASQGYCFIEELCRGDNIYTRKEGTEETALREIEEVFCTQAHTIYHIWLDGKEEIKTTAYHPIYIAGQGWVSVINLKEGDIAETIDGTAQITKIVKERYEEPVTVYDLQVKDWESYFVGETKLYVHNCGRRPTKRPSWRQTELDAASDYEEYAAQKSFKNGKEVPYGTRGSVRPDFCKKGHSMDTKNYRLDKASGRRRLVRNVVGQYRQRVNHLPAGTKQTVLADIRGQNIPRRDLRNLEREIRKRTGGGVRVRYRRR